MIAFIKGTVQSYGADWVVVDNNGMGWRIAYPHTDKIHLNDQVMIFTYLHYTENEISLYGFESQEEQSLFLRLISVKGLGPKTALNMLAKSSTNDLTAAISTGNINALKSMPGVGPKTAKQIILDLQGKLVSSPEPVRKGQQPSYSKEISDASEGLKNLGFKPAEASQAAAYMAKYPGHTVQEYIKMGLKYLSSTNREGGF